MKRTLKVSTVSILCAVFAGGALDAYGAASVRSLGGTGTYNSAASAASASPTTVTPTATTASSGGLRGGSVRVASGTRGRAAALRPVSASTSGVRTVTPTSRLSIGKYLDSATSISGGGSSIRPNPGGVTGGGSSSGGTPGGGTVDDGTVTELTNQIDDLQKQIDNVVTTLDGKQVLLEPREDGFIAVDDKDIYIKTDMLANALVDMGIAGDLSFQVNDAGMLQYQQGAGQWNDLIAISELVGTTDLSAYATIENMNSAIAAAVSNIDADIGALDAKIETKADKTYVDTELGKKQNTLVFDTTPTAGSANMVTSGAIADAIAAAVLNSGDALAGYATTEYVNQQMGVISSELATRVSIADAPRDGKEYVLSVVNGQPEYIEIVNTPQSGAVNE